jgi:tRNA(adenine34) deaminase
MRSHQEFMAEAVAQARIGFEEGEVPIGAVAVRGGEVIARGHNRRRALSDLTAHAEMICLRDLSAGAGAEVSFDLSDVTIYSTLEPCAMCSGAMIHYSVGRCVWGESDLQLGAAGGAMHILQENGVESLGGILVPECRQPLLDYFQRELGYKTSQWEDIRLPQRQQS